MAVFYGSVVESVCVIVSLLFIEITGDSQLLLIIITRTLNGMARYREGGRGSKVGNNYTLFDILEDCDL